MEQTALLPETDLKRQFEAALSRVKFELEKNLTEIDPLDTEKLENMLQIFNQRLIIFQHEFLEHLARLGSAKNNAVEEFKIETPPWDRIPEMAAAIIAGGAGGIAMALIPIGTTGFWFWASAVTAAAATGAALGVPAGIVTAGAGIIIGAGAGVGTAIFLKSKRRKLLRQKILEMFDRDIAPKLREWVVLKIGKN